MPDIIRELDALYGESSYDNPLVRIGEWRIFMHGFVPAVMNMVLIAKILAWNPGSGNHYVSIPGIDGAFKYEKGCALPVNIDSCRINNAAVYGGDFNTFVGGEILKSVHELAAFICAEEGLFNPLEARPLTLKDISGGERVLWSGESRGQALRVLRQDDGLLALQVGSDSAWEQLWP